MVTIIRLASAGIFLLILVLFAYGYVGGVSIILELLFEPFESVEG
ncbi:hypothetical protein PCCS19_53500 [Paenibacillus sp. CCS19]|nr:hypothetical protein PCCS19_53500 [Paenibacillus cellulosilyticus]